MILHSTYYAQCRETGYRLTHVVSVTVMNDYLVGGVPGEAGDAVLLCEGAGVGPQLLQVRGLNSEGV